MRVRREDRCPERLERLWRINERDTIGASRKEVDDGDLSYVELIERLLAEESAARASAPDTNDLIIDCASQSQMYPTLIDAIRQQKSVLVLP